MATKTTRTKTARKPTTRVKAAAPAKTKRRAADDEDGDDIGARRAVWKGSISFGLIDIPVALRSAEKREGLSFSMLDKRDFSPIRFERVNAKTGKPVTWDQIVKGYQYEKGEYVLVSEQELKKADPEATQTVDIVAFVDAKEIAPEFIEKPYVLEPMKRGRKGYALLREVLERTGRAGIARVVVTTKQYLAAVVPRDQVLVLLLMRWADEVVDIEKLRLPGVDTKALGISAKELDMAEMLVDGMYQEWDPKQYHDEYRESVLEMIEKKVRSGNVHAVDTTPPEPKPDRGGDVVDFMSLLKKSLEQKTSSAKATASRKRAAASDDDEEERESRGRRSRRSA